MARVLGVQIGLLAFAVAIVAGIYVGNPGTLVLGRALLAMVVGTVVGQLAGVAIHVVLREHLVRRKTEIDQAHLAAVRAMMLAAEADAPEPPAAPEAV